MKANCAEFSRYNGTGWDLIAKRTGITVGSRDTDVIEGEDTLDCAAGSTVGKTYEPGQKTLDEWSISVSHNPSPTPGENPENHHLLTDDYKSQTATFYRVKNANGTGYIVHAFVKSDGSVDYSSGSTLVKEFTLQPTGEIVDGYSTHDDVEAEEVPAGITAPQAGYTAG